MVDIMSKVREVYIKKPLDSTAVPSPEYFGFREVEVEEPQEGEILVKNESISPDQTMVKKADPDSLTKTYLEPLSPGDTMTMLTTAIVVKSKSPLFKEGDRIYGMHPIREMFVLNAEGVQKTELPAGVTHILNTGYLPGQVGIVQVGELEKWQAKLDRAPRVVVSSASGGVGLVTCEYAKAKGAEAIAISSGDKCKRLKEDYGIEHVIDRREMKNADDYVSAFEAIGDIDIVLDNCGGDFYEGALRKMASQATKGVIALCGSASLQYTDGKDPNSSPEFEKVTGNQSEVIEGVAVRGYLFTNEKYLPGFESAIGEFIEMYSSGKINPLTTDVHGTIDEFYKAYEVMASSQNFGKTIFFID
jgi:NADPH-dependent curcumin reductase CurA